MNIYAELNKKMRLKIDAIIVPSGVILERKSKWGACYFECDDEKAKKELIEILDDNEISWQEND